MKRTLELVLGVLTFAPLAIGLVSIVRLLNGFLSIAGSGGSVAPDMLSRFMFETFALNLVAAGLTVVLLLFYLWHLFVRRASLDPKEQLLWFLLLFLFSVVAMPVYWFVHFWNEAPAAVPPPPCRRMRARPAR